jgi:folate-dependent phosphoribosylglycinamide formyltransferase PurN
MKIVILASQGDLTNALYNYLVNEYDVERVIIEKPVSRKIFLKKRIKKLGIKKVIGQLLFVVMIQKPLFILSKHRIKEISVNYNLNYKNIPKNKILNVNSINDSLVKSELKTICPKAIIVFGTRIIDESILNSIDARFINMHSGITPLYRGVHGGYWALVSGDMKHCGVTVHLVDKGIDTGNVIEQAIINITKEDNFVTYPYLQFGEGLKLYSKALKMIEESGLKTKIVDLPSKLWSHPTLIEYIKFRIKINVK